MRLAIKMTYCTFVFSQNLFPGRLFRSNLTLLIFTYLISLTWITNSWKQSIMVEYGETKNFSDKKQPWLDKTDFLISIGLKFCRFCEILSTYLCTHSTIYAAHNKKKIESTNPEIYRRIKKSHETYELLNHGWVFWNRILKRAKEAYGLVETYFVILDMPRQDSQNHYAKYFSQNTRTDC